MLMTYFLQHPNQVISKETLYQAVWGEDFFGSDNTVMVHIRRLREKIENTPSKPDFLVTVKGLGYKFVVRMRKDELAINRQIYGLCHYRDHHYSFH